MNADVFRNEVRARVRATEVERQNERNKAGRHVLGARRILRQHWNDAPETIEKKSEINPRFAAKNPLARIAALREFKIFLEAYRIARQEWLMGANAVFPPGTYWLRKFAAVPIAAT